MNKMNTLAALVALSAMTIGTVRADEASEDALKQANNPLANFTSFNFQNYYVPEISGAPDATANTAFLRYVKPFGSWLVRATLPVQRIPTANGNVSGLGEFNIFATYLFETGNPNISMGAGPLLSMPTNTGDVPGDTWDVGAAAVYFNAESRMFQYGGLVTWQTDVGGSGPPVNSMAIQPFGIFQLGKGLYLRSTGVWNFDLENGNYVVPIGMGIGKVVKAGDKVFNFYLEPQFAILSDGPGQPDYQIFAGFNIQVVN